MSIAKNVFWALLLISFAGCTKTAQENAAQQHQHKAPINSPRIGEMKS